VALSLALGVSFPIGLTAAEGAVEVPAMSLVLEHAANKIRIDKVRKSPHSLLVILIPHGFDIL
jgi:hypothetical protein